MYARGFFLGLFMGAAISAVISLLYAPVKGEQARTMVKEKSRAVAGKVGDMTSAAGAKMQKAGQEIKQAI